MTGRPHILFVDDESAMLSGLRRMLRGRRDRWEMSFAASGNEALEILGSSVCDVIVADYRVQNGDGASLLHVVRDTYPGTARLILAGHPDRADLLKVILLAHQFVHRPCQEQDLVAAIERVLGLRSTIGNEDVRRQISGMDSLPSPPSTLQELLAALESEDASPRSVARVLEKDPAAAAKVLQVVNSSASGVSVRIGDIAQAVTLMGLRNVRALVLMHDLVRDFDAGGVVSAEWVTLLTQNAVETSRLARHIASGTPWLEDAFVAGLLHEVGQLAVASCRPAAFATHLSIWTEGDGSLSPIEISTFGVDHAGVGAYLLGLWGLPLSVIDAVAGHAQLVGVTKATNLVSTVALAHALVEAELGPLCGRRDGALAPDEEELNPAAAVGLDRWRREREREAARAG